MQVHLLLRQFSLRCGHSWTLTQSKMVSGSPGIFRLPPSKAGAHVSSIFPSCIVPLFPELSGLTLLHSLRYRRAVWSFPALPQPGVCLPRCLSSLLWGQQHRDPVLRDGWRGMPWVKLPGTLEIQAPSSYLLPTVCNSAPISYSLVSSKEDLLLLLDQAHPSI